MHETVLLTGGTGFLGAIIRKNLAAKGFSVRSLGRSADNDIRCDLSEEVPSLTMDFDIVIHNAGMAHVVPRTMEQKKKFIAVNVNGTQNLLIGLEKLEKTPNVLIFISSIAVYGLTMAEHISEDHPLQASDPYGKTKIQAEEKIRDWCSRNCVSLAILRLPLIIGENPPGNLGAMIEAMRKGFYISIAGGKAKKSMVLGEDVASFIPQAIKHPNTYNLTDGYHPCLRELELLIANQASLKVPFNVPYWAARLLGFGGDLVNSIFPGKAPVTSNKVRKLVSTLTFDDARARRVGWRPRQILSSFKLQ